MEESVIDILGFQTTNGASSAAIDPSFTYIIIGRQTIDTSPPSKNFNFLWEV